MSDAETTVQWAEQIAIISERYTAALRAGETLEGFEAWLAQVPESVRPSLKAALQRCRDAVQADSVETRVLSSDAVLGHVPMADSELLPMAIDGASAVGECLTFQGLSPSARRSLEERFETQTFACGEHILRQGQQAQGLHLVLSGSVEIIDVANGERIDCDGAGSVLGEMSLLMNEPCSAEVIAITDVRTLVLSAQGYRELKTEHPEVEIALSQLVSDRLGGRRHDALCGKVIGDYRLLRCLNRGGMGVVYEAEPLPIRERSLPADRVALKMLRHRFIYDDPMQQRFEQEAKLLAGLRHPNIISFREHFLAYRTRFLVLDLCDGADLYQVLRMRGPLDEATVRAILGQIARGLLFAHRAGVIHRDLKPGNVLVDRDGNVKLTDFGLSKLLASEAPAGKAVGTPSYMPPEQFRTDDVGPECDWYALGCLVCEMLTGQILFAPGSWQQMYQQKRQQQPGPDWPQVPASDELRSVITDCLQPRHYLRTLDLERIAGWAGNVRQLFAPTG